MCKPLLPLIQDKLAHAFWKAEHISTVHHHHGDQHAHKEIAEAAHEQENDKQPAPTKISEPVSIHLVAQNTHAIPQLFIEKQKFALRNYKTSSFALDKHYPPPRPC